MDVAPFMPMALAIAKRQYFRGIGRDLGDMEDCCQTAVLVMLKAAARPHDPARGKRSTYIFDSVRRGLYERCQTAGLIRVPRGRAKPAFERIEDCLDYRGEAQGLDWLHDAVDRLPLPERQVISLLYFSQATYRATCAATGLSLWSVRTIERRGLDQLRKDFDS